VDAMEDASLKLNVAKLLSFDEKLRFSQQVEVGNIVIIINHRSSSSASPSASSDIF
jgi:ribosomal protein L13